jgi:murein DD-endopeptidase MepM/ murein hydrolase activator NlpD
LNQGRSRAYRTGLRSGTIDLGNEPPLSVDGEPTGEIDRRRVSVQWFSGTILTGLCGAALMGGAVFAALDGETNFAASPERYEATRIAPVNPAERSIRKTDRLPPPGESNSARNVIRISTTSRVGDREMVRVRPFIRVAANLSLTTSELTANIPPYNPQRLMNAPTPGQVATEAGAEPDAEVSFVTRDLSTIIQRAKIATVLPIEEVVARVREAANWTGAVSPKYASADVAAAGKLAYAADADLDPYAGFEARIVPENITLLPKTANETTGGNNANERTIPVKRGDTVAAILRELGATPEEIKAIAGVLGARGRDGGLKEGQKLRVLLSPTGGGKRMQPIRVVVLGEAGTEAVVALSDLGRFVPVDVQSAETQGNVAEDEEEDDGDGVRLYQSLYETGLRNQIPRTVIEDLVRIYSYDVDFQRKAKPGDSFEVFYASEDESGASEGKHEVLFAALTVAGENKRFYRYQAPDDGTVDYYDETGKSAKKFLVRKPVGAGIMRSGFGSRRHPILGYTKMHTGVDWAAPMGTPIYASGNGTVDKVGWESGYGKYIRLQHANGYETAYGHMTAYARGINPGVRVRQGQVIGYVGSTGLSTGAHLHYEILVNGRFVDPMRIRLPRGRVLDGPALASFERERDRLNTLMSQKPSRVATASGR